MIRDLDALGEGAQMIPPITAAFDPQAAARGLRKRVDHLRRHGPIARAIKRHPYPLGVGGGLIADGLQIGDPVLQAQIVQRRDA
ncbi:hypothetical protein [Sphingomonas sanguinis]|uniref:Uncharacterized protein n=1 Tax=Sphingomonas sanguinis TaxID=33051 RepID=A0A147JBH8_9SPHN|nr:hypothetical protein [Sphingomonas sanguinis]KTW16567.1 hypothetical protein NS258_03390 [Sphingomonas sanguinis]